ncbi:MAG: RNA methyltransferase [Candidatus Amulumruptor caecigallinarius]|nr:RNA methyltransferase [Candidatus Amulumruptor caecigallinarius]
MPTVNRLNSLSSPLLSPYVQLTDRQLRVGHGLESPLIVVESPKVIKVALQQGLKPVSLLCEERHIKGDAAEVIAMCDDDMPVLTAPREMLESLTGYKLTRGVLCAMQRPELPDLKEIVEGKRRVCVIDGVCDTTNIGAIFRCAAALGIDAVLLTDSACDPFNRRSIRVSMGSVFLVPWTRIASLNNLRSFGFKTVAMALRHNSIDISDPLLKNAPALALVLGTEGDGLSDGTISSADYVVKIPMHHNVDSLNVAAASAIAFWEFTKIN